MTLDFDHAQIVAVGDVDAVEWDRPGSTTWMIDVGDGVDWPMHVVNGTQPGPVALVCGGVHGDELEGPALVAELCRITGSADISGSLMLLPAVSPLGLAARTRYCPVDLVDPNRSFPGDRQGSVTCRIAAMMARSLIPRADLIYDLHGGGATDAIVPSVMIYPREDREQTRLAVNAMVAFGAPASVMANPAGSESMLDGEAARQGKVFGCVELGSFGSIGRDVLEIGRRGIHNVLVDAGIVAGPSRSPLHWKWNAPRFFVALDADHEVRAPASGYLVPNVEIGDQVDVGTVIGEIVDLGSPAIPSLTISAHRSGLVYIRAAGGPVTTGMSIVTLIDEVSGPDAMLAALERAQSNSDMER